jgi:hypothetical protein
MDIRFSPARKTLRRELGAALAPCAQQRLTGVRNGVAEWEAEAKRWRRYNALWIPYSPIWFEEIILFGLDILDVLSVLLVTGPILLFNHFVFRSATPTLKDKRK